jgi:hypothetical protein
MAKRKAWTRDENVALVGLYSAMLNEVLAGRKYNKAAMIRVAQAGSLSDRSRGSIEAKLMNLTAVYRDLGQAYTMEHHGYKALSGYQKGLREVAEAFIYDAVKQANAA